ncbi:hypothetical protein [Streptomyces sp. A012304]|uniref:hypothetical protein n=1 Tax=Streptomyces sp. A012304 TaxID=375446 RepID=UPI0022307D52|nr:hypothetical protein [Streptomyces sp. A012304]GKQ37236.1 hypothetical protein ALMP_37740 [Streptomyces sp. A012304]
MTEQAARLSGACEGCGRPGVGWAVQLVMGGRLRWETEWACDVCGIAHDGGWGPSPAHVREAIVGQHGLHRLRPRDDEVRGAGVLKAFRDAFGLSLREAREAADSLRAGGYEGTYVETRLLSDLLHGQAKGDQE